MLSMNCKLFYCLNSCSKLFQSSAIHKMNYSFLLNCPVLSSLRTLVNFVSFVRVYNENVGIQQVRETIVLRDNVFHESNLRITKL